MKRVILFLTVCVLGMVLGNPSPRMEAMKKDYAFEQWRDFTSTNYPVRVDEGWQKKFPALNMNGIDVTYVQMPFREGMRTIVKRQGSEIVRIDTQVLGGPEEAHLSIIKEFSRGALRISYKRLENGTGDVHFYHKSLRVNGDVSVFARNNVFVSIDSYLESCSATNIAKQIDASILRASGINP
ncbi:MAG: hypothetical protein Q4G65_18535 [bacterium]|nr:hypothetical protein [bacterium]